MVATWFTAYKFDYAIVISYVYLSMVIVSSYSYAFMKEVLCHINFFTVMNLNNLCNIVKQYMVLCLLEYGMPAIVITTY